MAGSLLKGLANVITGPAKALLSAGEGGGDLVMHKTAGGVLTDASGLGNFASENSGLERYSARNKLMALAISSPELYFTRRQEEIEEIIENQNKVFQARFTRLLNESVPEAVARSRAQDYADRIAQIDLAELQLSYPENITDFSVAQGLKRSTANLPAGMIGPKAPRKRTHKK